MRNKRIALNQDDITLICTALEQLHRSAINNPVAYPEYEMASRQRVNEVRQKLGRDSVELIKVQQVKKSEALPPVPDVLP